MSEAPATDVFTADEVARAARLPRQLIDRLIAAGELRLIPGTRYITAADALAAGRRLRQNPPAVALPPANLFGVATRRASIEQRRGLPAIFSSCAHTVVLLVIMWLTAGAGDTAAVAAPEEPARLVFLITPGPGGGGGGGGLRNPLPPQREQRRGAETLTSVPAVTPKPELTTVLREPEEERPSVVPAIQPPPVERDVEPAPPAVVAPVVEARADAAEEQGVIEHARTNSTSQGPGAGAGSGAGQGNGNGEGLGAGIGAGAGGGTGGGPYRPGSGIEPPRLLREVKAEYTEEARRRGLSGDVVLEIVVRHDGTVGDVRLLDGLGFGLDQRAVAAVRQWRFQPARRRGEPVDVLVEVAVEFTLR